MEPTAGLLLPVKQVENYAVVTSVAKDNKALADRFQYSIIITSS